MKKSESIIERIATAQRESSTILDLSTHMGGRSEALVTIPKEIFELTQLETLNLAGNKISSIPKEIIKLRNLKELILSGNLIISLPEEIGQLSNLTLLLLEGNPFTNIPDWIVNLSKINHFSFGSKELLTVPHWITKMSNLISLTINGLQRDTLPEWIGQMQNMKRLNLACNDLIDLPVWMFQLEKLEELSLSANQLTSLPYSIVQMRKLKRIDLWVNQLTEVPDFIHELTGLVELYLGGNKLSDIPFALSDLHNLEVLDLSNNRFTSIPDSVYLIKKLKNLDLSNAHAWSYNRMKEGEFSCQNEIKTISTRILKLSNLQRLNITRNPIEVPPPEVVEKGLAAINGYFRQIETEGIDHLYEAKLLILGEGGSGKTTLAKKIENFNYSLQDEKSTQGIDVIRWTFPMEEGRTFQVNVWDFGGQEIYHATHQFFLTKRSLYALVADTRKEDTDFYYWLNVVELLSDNSPLLIIKNEKQDRHREISERQLRGQYTNLKEVLTTNLASNRGLPEVLREIKHYICQLSHIGSPLPKTWVKVREALEGNPRDIISFDEYLDICQQNGFDQLKDKLQLSSYLHDLGVCLHFQEDPLLRKTMILKPKWGTDAVYKVLDNKSVIQNSGRFTQADLATIWKDPEYSTMQHELLQLMINFKLCYKIPSTINTYIAPQLLSDNQPDYDWNESDNLMLRCTYEFMPKGILTQLIVKMHPLISNQMLVWKSGVVLENDHTKAEIIEYYGKREIRIRVVGQHKKELMTIVMYELDIIHNSYRGLKFSKLIPCNCKTCKMSQSPFFYSFETLRKFIEDSQGLIQCQKSYEMVNVWRLIDDVVDRKQLNKEGELKFGKGFIFQGAIGQVVIQQTEGGDMNIQKSQNRITEPIEKNEVTSKSAWGNGLFYLLTFLSVITGVGILAKSLPFYILPIVLISGIIFVPLIGALQLRQDDRLSEKSFTDLMKLFVGQLPLIGKISAQFQKSNK